MIDGNSKNSGFEKKGVGWNRVTRDGQPYIMFIIEGKSYVAFPDKKGRKFDHVIYPAKQRSDTKEKEI